MKVVRTVVIGVVAAAAVRRFAGRAPDICRRMFEGMPDDFPPKRMAADLTAVRRQNERIIEMLESRPD